MQACKATTRNTGLDDCCSEPDTVQPLSKNTHTRQSHGIIRVYHSHRQLITALQGCATSWFCAEKVHIKVLTQLNAWHTARRFFVGYTQHVDYLSHANIPPS
jgi:hypothetical protein